MRLKGVKSNLMRVPSTFNFEVNRMKDKYGYSSNTEFLHCEVVPLLKNSDMLSDIFMVNKRNDKKKK